MVTANRVMGVTKMVNIVPRAGLEPPSLTFRARVLPLCHIGSLMSPLYPRPTVHAAPCLRGQHRLLHSFDAPCLFLSVELFNHTSHQLQSPACTDLDRLPCFATMAITIVNWHRENDHISALFLHLLTFNPSATHY